MRMENVANREYFHVNLSLLLMHYSVSVLKMSINERRNLIEKKIPIPINL